jgi:ABC-type nickel/cobalt efflux system permease component RcnA
LLTCLDYPGVLAVVVHREAPLRWSLDEEVLMSSHSSKTTTNHDEIRRWADARGAKPACVKGTGGNGDPGMIRLDFPGYSGSESLQQISWDEWFKAFDANDLALVYQDRTADGARSNFNKLVSRDTAEARAEGDSHASAHSHSHSHSNSHSHSHEHRHDSRS